VTVTLTRRRTESHGPVYVVKSTRRVTLLPEESEENRRRTAAMRRQNYTTNEIALQLGVSSRTVERYMARNREEAEAETAA
jgi:IS30 family transposase